MEAASMPEEGNQGDEKNLPPLTFDDEEHVFDIQFHPSKDIFAVALLSGPVRIFTYSCEFEDHKQQVEFTHHKQSCRALQFSADGKYLYSGSADRSIGVMDVNEGKLCCKIEGTHRAAINCLARYKNFLCSGDDEGGINIWDIKTGRPELKWKFDEHTDWITQMFPVEARNVLLATSGDGSLSVWNMNSGKCTSISDQMDDELLSVTVIKRNQKIICGSQGGILNIFSWGLFGDISDRFPGHPQSIDALIGVSEDMVLTGSSDGLIRLVQFFPHKLLGIIGEHGAYPIERLAISRDKTLLASSSHDNTIKFWDIRYLFETDSEKQEVVAKQQNQPPQEMGMDAQNPAETIEMDTEMVIAEEGGGEEVQHDSDDAMEDEEIEDTSRRKLANPHSRSAFFADL